MIKYAKIVNEETGLCEVGIGTNFKFYESSGMTPHGVMQSDLDNQWYLSEKCPIKSEAEKLTEAKTLKLAENVQKRGERLNAGVLYKDVMFDSDTDSKVNIMGAVSTLPDDAVLGWNSMDNQTVELTKAELGELGGLLVGLTSEIWGENGLNVQFINAINAAQSLEEVAAIEIEYTNKEVSDENTADTNETGNITKWNKLNKIV